MSAMLYTQTAEPLKMLLKGGERESDLESAPKKKKKTINKTQDVHAVHEYFGGLYTTWK